MREISEAQLEELEAKTEVIPIDLGNEEHRALLREYTNSDKSLNFNEFLASKVQKDYPGKIIVAEIRGDMHHTLGSSAPVLQHIGSTREDRDNNINVDGCNFTGCRLVGVTLMGDLEKVSFRDCHLERVRANRATFKEVDLRGASFEEMRFDWVYASNSQIQVEFGDLREVQKRGLFSMIDDGKAEDEIQALRDDIAIKIQKDKDRIFKLTWKQTLTLDLTGALEDPEKQAEFERVQKELAKEQAEKMAVIRRRHMLSFSNVSSDRTYTPNQDAAVAAQKKVSIAVTKDDMDEYKQLRGKDKISLSEFIDRKHRQTPEHDGARVVADMSRRDGHWEGYDFSGLNLSGVVCAYTNLKGCKFKNTKLQGSCLEGCEFDKHTTFEHANLIDTNLVAVSGEEVNFSKAIMIRTRMQCANLPEAKMRDAQMYALNGFKADLSNADMQSVEARRVKLKGAILQSVDARNARLEQANLEGAVLRDANLEKARLNGAVMRRVDAEGADLTRAVLDDVKAEYANFREATLKEMVAKGANFTAADLEKANARGAAFKKATLEKVNARAADFTASLLEDAKAARANFTEATLEKVRGKRVDLREAALTRVKAEGANLTEAVMTQVDAYKADFQKAILTGANLEGANFTATDFERARLDHVRAKNTKFVATNFEGANVKYIEIDSETLLLDANLRGVIGAEKMKALQEDQHKLQKRWFGESKYGHCKSNLDGSNDRFRCQRIGAAVLSAAIGGGTGLTLAGPFAGVSSAAVTAFVGDNALVAIKQGYYEDLGYINNTVGDKLAEIGAVAMASGINGLDRAIDGAAAGMVCSAAGAVTGVVATGVGAISALKGVQMMWNGYHNQSRWQKFVGAVLTAVGSALTFVGLSNMSASLSTVAYSSMFGAAAGAIWSMGTSVRALVSYKEKDGKVVSGQRPEQIFRTSLEQLSGIKRKLLPTTQKIIVSVTLAVAAVAVAAIGVQAASVAVGGALLAKLTVGTPVLITAAAAGLIGGYLYDDKVIGAAKFVSDKVTFQRSGHKSNIDSSDAHERSEQTELQYKSEEKKKASREDLKKETREVSQQVAHKETHWRDRVDPKHAHQQEREGGHEASKKQTKIEGVTERANGSSHKDAEIERREAAAKRRHTKGG